MGLVKSGFFNFHQQKSEHMLWFLKKKKKAIQVKLIDKNLLETNGSSELVIAEAGEGVVSPDFASPGHWVQCSE